MKYLKLFENFRDDREDAIWIVTSALDPIEVDEVPFDKEYGDTSMFRLFELSEEPSEDKINHLKSWLEGEGYYFHSGKYKTDLKTSIFRYKTNNGIIVTDKPIKEACIDWLNTNYSNLESVESKDYPGCVIYRYVPKDNILFYNIKNRKVYIRYELIWSFFEHNFGLREGEIKCIIEDWLSATYNLNGVTTGYGFQSNSVFTAE